jgi:hypothetical protein
MLLDGVLDNPEIWHKMVSEYSRLDLLFAKDKLRAISGIAKQLDSTSGGEYLAGL